MELSNNQPDLQPTSQAQVTGSSSSIDNLLLLHLHGIDISAEERKLIRPLLVWLHHAYKCQFSDLANDQASRCTLPSCRAMKVVLMHIATCKKGNECTKLHCDSSKQIMAHWKQCKMNNCFVCGPFGKQEDKNKAANTGAGATTSNSNIPPLDSWKAYNGHRIQGPVTTGIPSVQGLNLRQRMPGIIGNEWPSPSSINQTTGFTTGSKSIPPNGSAASATNAQHSLSMQQLFGLNDSRQPSILIENRLINLGPPGGLELSQVTAKPIQGTNAWHQCASQSLRNVVVGKLVEELFKAPDFHAMLVDYAKDIEVDIYGTSNSRTEYINSLKENMLIFRQPSKN